MVRRESVSALCLPGTADGDGGVQELKHSPLGPLSSPGGVGIRLRTLCALCGENF
jgi:hypothetical protein